MGYIYVLATYCQFTRKKENGKTEIRKGMEKKTLHMISFQVHNIPTPWDLNAVHCRQLIGAPFNDCVYEVGSFPSVSELPCRRVHGLLEGFPQYQITYSEYLDMHMLVVGISNPFLIGCHSYFFQLSHLVYYIQVVCQFGLVHVGCNQPVSCCRHHDFCR